MRESPPWDALALFPRLRVLRPSPLVSAVSSIGDRSHLYKTTRANLRDHNLRWTRQEPEEALGEQTSPSRAIYQLARERLPGSCHVNFVLFFG